ncbi:MAG TPA: ribonuclease H-like domain-containing protein [Chthonomonadales bacterium]|nr:ribonuclease H-like domain-containing protein [Chthonomonadales bacterium]
MFVGLTVLESTYIHCPGVGEKTERRIWEAGARTWSDFVAMGARMRISGLQRAVLEPLICESIERLAGQDYRWFSRVLPQREHWRAFPAFRHRIAYLDIETTGGYGPHDLTVVGLYDGYRMRHFVRGDNLAEFPEAIKRAAIIVTFFGTGFDLPFLRRAFRMDFPQLHIDLCFLFKRLGYSGGLKYVERQLGLTRSEETRGLAGWDAVRLWAAYRHGSEKALETLLAYNAEDVLNMETLMEMAYAWMFQRTMGGETGNAAPIG